jgi:outer membrane cobalamin receptor
MGALPLFMPQLTGIVYAAEAVSGGEFVLEALTVEAKRPDWESKLSPGTVTIIRPDDYKGEQKTLPEMLQDVPGVHVRYVSGKGQYTTVTVRGSTAAQVGVFVDGVLSNLGGDAAVDISTIPVSNVERIEVYRGYIPARFGGTYMGGVINVVTKRPEQTNISASIGQSSWGGYKGSLEITEPLGSGSLMIGINRDESDGDFRYKNPGVAGAYRQAKATYDEYMNNGWINGINNTINNANRLVKNSGIDYVVSNFSSAAEAEQALLGSDFDQRMIKAYALYYQAGGKPDYEARAEKAYNTYKNGWLAGKDTATKKFYETKGIFTIPDGAKIMTIKIPMR